MTAFVAGVTLPPGTALADPDPDPDPDPDAAGATNYQSSLYLYPTN